MDSADTVRFSVGCAPVRGTYVCSVQCSAVLSKSLYGLTVSTSAETADARGCRVAGAPARAPRPRSMALAMPIWLLGSSGRGVGRPRPPSSVPPTSPVTREPCAVRPRALSERGKREVLLSTASIHKHCTHSLTKSYTRSNVSKILCTLAHAHLSFFSTQRGESVPQGAPRKN